LEYQYNLLSVSAKALFINYSTTKKGPSLVRKVSHGGVAGDCTPVRWFT